MSARATWVSVIFGRIPKQSARMYLAEPGSRPWSSAWLMIRYSEGRQRVALFEKLVGAELWWHTPWSGAVVAGVLVVKPTTGLLAAHEADPTRASTRGLALWRPTGSSITRRTVV